MNEIPEWIRRAASEQLEEMKNAFNNSLPFITFHEITDENIDFYANIILKHASSSPPIQQVRKDPEKRKDELWT